MDQWSQICITFDEKDPDQHQSKRQDPDTPQSEKADPDRIQGGVDPRSANTRIGMYHFQAPHSSKRKQYDS